MIASICVSTHVRRPPPEDLRHQRHVPVVVGNLKKIRNYHYVIQERLDAFLRESVIQVATRAKRDIRSDK